MPSETILCLHGALGSGREMMHLAELLSGRFEVICPDFPGHGLQSATSEYSIRNFSISLEELIGQSLLPVYLFGYSMGGYVALDFARRHPGKVKGIITLGTKFDWNQEFAAAEVQKLQPDLMETKIPKFTAQLEKLHGDKWKAVVLGTAGLMNRLGGGEALSSADFAGISCPVQIMRGSDDKMVGWHESEKIAHMIPQGNVKQLENTPHQLDKVNPQLLTESITAFIHAHH